MITVHVLQSELTEWKSKLGTLAGLPLILFKGAPKATKLAQQCAMALSAVEKIRAKRLQVLQRMFNLAKCPTSTYDLTVAQAYALRELAYTEDYGVSDDFIRFAQTLMRAGNTYDRHQP